MVNRIDSFYEGDFRNRQSPNAHLVAPTCEITDDWFPMLQVEGPGFSFAVVLGAKTAHQVITELFDQMKDRDVTLAGTFLQQCTEKVRRALDPQASPKEKLQWD